MKFLVLILMMFATELVVAKEFNNAKKTDAELRSDFKSEKNAEKKFYMHSEIVHRYLLERITPKSAKEASEWANGLLKAAAPLKKNWNYGNAVHYSHLLLGKVRLSAADKAGAGAELLLAGQTPGSPQLNSFGPNMSLAKELVEKGEKQVVLKYFELCLKFWKSKEAKPQIEEWKKEMKAGKIPGFGAHLVY